MSRLDVILHTPNVATLVAFGEKYPPGNPLIQQDRDGNRVFRKGLEWCWWAGSGDFKTKNAEHDEDGNETSPATYAPGKVLLLRIDRAFFDDRLDPDPQDPNYSRQWMRSKVIQYLKNNGTPGTLGGIPYIDLAGVKWFDPDDIDTFRASRNLVGHEWLGGNYFKGEGYADSSGE